MNETLNLGGQDSAFAFGGRDYGQGHLVRLDRGGETLLIMFQFVLVRPDRGGVPLR